MAEGLEETLTLHRLKGFTELGVSFKTTTLIEICDGPDRSPDAPRGPLADERSEAAVVRVGPVGDGGAVSPREAP
jgi:hypothetical protein